VTRPLFLLSNDDGVHAAGLHALRAAVEDFADVVVVAPHVERSGAGQGLSLTSPLRMEKIAENTFAVEGTPTDCVIFALNKILDRKPDWVLSGINRGSNIAQDTLYSGTVAAAMEGVVHGIPAAAFSFSGRRAFKQVDYAAAQKIVTMLFQREDLIKPTAALGLGVLNVNIPDLPFEAIKGLKTATLGRRLYDAQIVEGTDPRGRKYFWIGGGGEAFADIPGSDCNLLADGFVTLSILRPDHVHAEANARLAESLRGFR
jgi:5'-nucleotidase